jgi:hypothetical protein
MDNNTQAILLNVIMPLVVTGAFNIILFRLQSKERKPKQDTEIAAELQMLSLQLTKQVRASAKREHELLIGIAKLCKQITALGHKPVWRPNGKEVNIDK